MKIAKIIIFLLLSLLFSPWGEVISQADEKETILYTDIDTEYINTKLGILTNIGSENFHQQSLLLGLQILNLSLILARRRIGESSGLRPVPAVMCESPRQDIIQIVFLRQCSNY